MNQSPQMAFSGLVAFVAVLLILPQLSLAKSVAYCSTENTSDSEKIHWPWQSQGWCNDACKADHPYGIVQGEYCWCSDYAPQNQLSVSDCSGNCPGYPDEKCGNDEDNLFLYVMLDSTAKVKGTKGVSEPTSSSVSPSSSARPVSSFASSTKAPSSSETLTNPPAASSTPYTSAVPNSDTLPPITSVKVITVSGVIVTQTVTSDPTTIPVTPQSKKSNAGAIAGGVIGGIAVLCAVAGAVLFTLWRRRRRNQEDGTGQSGVQRNVGTMSRMPFGSGNGPQYPPALATNYNSRSSRMMDSASVSPISVSDRRSSRLVFDQRLNPSAIMVLDNPSRASFASMDDSRDYGRTLNVRNPDPDS